MKVPGRLTSLRHFYLVLWICTRRCVGVHRVGILADRAIPTNARRWAGKKKRL